MKFVLAFLILALVFGLLERIRPQIRGQRFWRAGFATDSAWLTFAAFAARAINVAALIAVAWPILLALGVPFQREAVQAYLERPTWISSQPIGVQVALILVGGDLFRYWVHRAFHRGWLWRCHAIHHSSRELDWLSSVRVHPLNAMIPFVGEVVVAVLLGFHPGVIAAWQPFLTLHAILLHSNVPWTFGPLGRVISSPAFHRWHHSAEVEGLDKNFAGLFPWIDALFGTLYLPKGQLPRRFGVHDGAAPEGFWRQLAAPFGRKAVRAPAA